MSEEIPQPDYGFIEWLKAFDPELRCRWNPQRKRWVIDERNRETRHWQCILVWETDDGAQLPLSRDLCLRLELMRAKYKKLILSPGEYVNELVRNAEAKERHKQLSMADDRRHMIVSDIKHWRQAVDNARSGILK